MPDVFLDIDSDSNWDDAVIFDPGKVVEGNGMRLWELRGAGYLMRADRAVPLAELSFSRWRGVYEGTNAFWQRWCDADGRLIPTRQECAET